MERGNFTEALAMLKEGNTILQRAAESDDYPGFSVAYVCRLTADLYAIIGKIEYELNLPNHGGSWFKKAEMHRQKLIQDDLVEAFDLRIMAIEDSSIALASLADTSDPSSTIATCTSLMEQYGSESGRWSWAWNLGVAYRFKGDLEESLEWCEKSVKWTRELYGDYDFRMAM